MLEGIEKGSWSRLIQRLRTLEKGTPAFDKIKTNLPAFMLSATTNGGRKTTDVEHHSGLLQIDLDGVGIEHAADLRDRIGEDRHILAAWISPSGEGVKAIMRIAADIAQHKASFDAAADYMRGKYDVAADLACSNVNRLCYVSHDAEIKLNTEAVPLEICGASRGAKPMKGEGAGGSSTAYCVLHNKQSALHNKIFLDFAGLPALYQKLVAQRYGTPQRGTRNNLVMKEIVPLCFFALAHKFAAAFAEEFYRQNEQVFSDYDFESFMSEVNCVLEGCRNSYPHQLTEAERCAYAALEDENERAAFRIAKSLSQCESEGTMPPLFFLSCANLATRLGIFCMQAGRILKSFAAKGLIKIEKAGAKRASGQRGIAAVYRWLL